MSNWALCRTWFEHLTTYTCT